ncbi:MAG: Co2+/Mg2+ efflux protein ApaG [Flavobacteriales bacterium]
MSTTISHGIRVTAKSRYETGHSDPKVGRFVFSYRITIANHGETTIQLMRRQWKIRDSAGPMRTVEGPGVVGETPVLAPGMEFSYRSACELRSGWGRMDGTYLMVPRPAGQAFTVPVPTIMLLVPFASN